MKVTSLDELRAATEDHGHDDFANARVVTIPSSEVEPYPGVRIGLDEAVVVLSQSDPDEPAELLIVVAQAWDHHGDDARAAVAQRIAEVLAQ